MSRVAVIYDTSYLMALRPLPHESVPHLRNWPLTHFVPEEVQEELERHRTGPDERKRHAASGARKIVAQLKGLPLPQHRFEGTRADTGARAAPAQVAQPPASILGADSRTDRLLVAVARRAVESGGFLLAIVATDDGGILNDVVDLRTGTGLPVYAASGPRDLLQSEAFLDRVRPRLLTTFEGHARGVTWLTMSSDGRYVASSGLDRMILLWSIPERRRAGSIGPHAAPIYKLLFGPAARCLASTHGDGTIKLWNLPDGSPHGQPLSGCDPNFVLFSPDGRFLAVRPNQDAATLTLLDLVDGRLTHLRFGPMPLTCAAFAPDGRTLATGHKNGAIAVLELPVARQRLSLVQGASAQPVTAVAIGRQGVLAAANSLGDVQLWDAQDGRALAPARGFRTVDGLRFRDDGRLLAVAGAEGGILGLPSGDLLLSLPDAAGANFVFRADGKTLAAACAQDTRVWPWLPDAWPAAAGEQQVVVTADPPPQPIAFRRGAGEDAVLGPDGRVVATVLPYHWQGNRWVDGDPRIRLWELPV